MLCKYHELSIIVKGLYILSVFKALYEKPQAYLSIRYGTSNDVLFPLLIWLLTFSETVLIETFNVVGDI
jgi:hypothetical protein